MHEEDSLHIPVRGPKRTYTDDGRAGQVIKFDKPSRNRFILSRLNEREIHKYSVARVVVCRAGYTFLTSLHSVIPWWSRVVYPGLTLRLEVDRLSQIFNVSFSVLGPAGREGIHN